jgi:hypothetical protein
MRSSVQYHTEGTCCEDCNVFYLWDSVLAKNYPKSKKIPRFFISKLCHIIDKWYDTYLQYRGFPLVSHRGIRTWSLYSGIWIQSPWYGACWTLLSMKSWETPQAAWTTRALGTLNSNLFTDVSPSLSRESNNKFNHLTPKGRGCKSL